MSFFRQTWTDLALAFCYCWNFIAKINHTKIISLLFTNTQRTYYKEECLAPFLKVTEILQGLNLIGSIDFLTTIFIKRFFDSSSRFDLWNGTWLTFQDLTTVVLSPMTNAEVQEPLASWSGFSGQPRITSTGTNI